MLLPVALFAQTQVWKTEVQVYSKPEIELVENYMVCNKETSIVLDYVNHNNLTLEYVVTFSNKAKNVGFQDILAYTLLGDDVVINIPPGISIDGYAGTLTVRNGACEESYDFTITLASPAVISRQPASIAAMCEGDNILLSVQASGTNITYQWYHNGTAITGATDNEYSAIYHSGLEGDYYVEITTDCGTIASNTVTVSGNMYQIQEKWDDALFIANPSDAIIAYQWVKDGQDIKQYGRSSYYSDALGLQGTYYVRIYFADGSYIKTCPVTYDRRKATTTNLYPNPVNRSTMITIELGEELEETSISKLELYDAQGRLIRDQMVEGNHIKIQAPKVAGAYIVRIHAESSRIISKRLIVK